MLPPVKIYTTPNDLKYALFDQPEVISDAIRSEGIWNSGCLDLCDKVLLKNPGGGRVIDIGAGFGAFTVPLAARYGDQFMFTAYEPLPAINLQLNTNILLNLLSSVRVHNCALSDTSELLELPTLDVERSANHGSFSFNAHVNKMRGIPDFEKKEVFEFKTLDSFRFAGVRLLKISAPGMEFRVLNGAAETLMNSGYPPVLFEAWNLDWYKEERDKILDFFASRAYEHYVVFGDHMMTFKTKSEYDVLLSDAEPVQLGSYRVVEQSHDVNSVILNQAPLR